MTIDLADRRSVPEAGRLDRRLSFKQAESDEPYGGQTLALDEAEGIVTAIVSVTGIEDDVADIIIPGAYQATLVKRRPKVCWAHAWEHPIGRTLYIEELRPGDPRLPVKARDGSPWPKKAGALVASMQFNLRTDEGKQAFEAVRFYSETGECEWSIGYNVPPGGSTKVNGVRHIKVLDLYELSVVLFGAHPMTGTLSIKQAVAQMVTKAQALADGLDLAVLSKAAKRPNPFAKKPAADEEPDPTNTRDQAVADQTATDEENAATDAADQAEETTDAPASAPGEGDEGTDAEPDFSDGVMVAVYPDQEAANAVYQHIAGPDATLSKDDLHVTLAYLGKVGDLSVSEEDLNNLVMGAVEDSPALTGQVAGIGEFPPGDEGTPTWVPVDVAGLSLLREQVCSALGDMAYTDHGFTPHMTLGYDIGMIDPVPPTPVTFDRVSVVYGNSRRDYTLERTPGNLDGTKVSHGTIRADTINTGTIGGKAAPSGPDGWYLRFDTGERFVEGKRKLDADQRRKKPTLPGSDTAWPIGDVTDLDAAVRSFGRAKADEKDKVKRWIIKRARELGALGHLPDDWKVTKVRLDAYDPAYDEAFDSVEVKAEGGADRNRGGAERLRHYWTRGPGAAKIAWGTPGDFTRCVTHLSKYMGERAKGYCADRHKEVTGMWPGDRNNKSLAVPAGAKMFPTMPGSYQERIDMIRQAVGEQYEGQPLDEGEHRWINLEAVWDDHCVYVVEVNSETSCDRHAYMAPYYLDSDTDAVVVGEPQEVQLEIIALPEDEDAETDEDGARYESDDDVPLGDAMPYAETLTMLTASLKSAVAGAEHQRAEGKAGRVLSGANERALRSAFQHLGNVLAAAGIQIDAVTPENPTPLANNTGSGSGTESDPHYVVDPRADVETTSPEATIKAAKDTEVKVVTRADLDAMLHGLDLD